MYNEAMKLIAQIENNPERGVGMPADRQIIRICRLYYESKKSQEEIAQLEGISKSTVSRILNKAMESGYITVSITYPIANVTDLEDAFASEFGLKRISISQVIVEDDNLIIDDVCKSLIHDLPYMVHDDDVIGISWGTTLNHLAGQLKPIKRQNIKIVQLNGGISRNIRPTNATQITERFAEALQAEGYIMPLPAKLDTPSMVGMIKQDSGIKDVFSLIDRAKTAIFSVGGISRESVLISAGYYTQEDYEQMRAQGAVGDICSRYIRQDGTILDKHSDACVIGVELDALRQKENRICIASGRNKAAGILAGIYGGYINTLYTDETTAKSILKIHEERSASTNIP